MLPEYCSQPEGAYGGRLCCPVVKDVEVDIAYVRVSLASKSLGEVPEERRKTYCLSEKGFEGNLFYSPFLVCLPVLSVLQKWRLLQLLQKHEHNI